MVQGTFDATRSTRDLFFSYSFDLWQQGRGMLMSLRYRAVVVLRNATTAHCWKSTGAHMGTAALSIRMPEELKDADADRLKRERIERKLRPGTLV